MLRELVALRPREAILREYEDGPVPDGYVRVAVDYGASKHGTELHLFRGDDPFLANSFDNEYRLFFPDKQKEKEPYFMEIGNMFVGHVTETGKGVDSIREGTRVAGYSGLRSTVTVKPERLIAMDENMNWKEAVCYDPCHFALGGIRDGKVRLGDAVAVFGLGAIGQMTAQMAKLAGASIVVAVDPIENRRKAALDNGADAALDPSAFDVGLELKKITGKRGVDVAIETSANYKALQQAIRGIAYCGNVTIVGWYNECTGGLNLGREAHFNQPNIIVSRACSAPNRDYPRWNWDRITDTCWNMLSQGLIKCDNIVEPVVAFKDAPVAYTDVDLHPELSIKMGVDFRR